MKRDDEEYFKKIQDYVDTTKTVVTDTKEFLVKCTESMCTKKHNIPCMITKKDIKDLLLNYF